MRILDDDSLVLFHADTRKEKFLNPVGKLIWLLLDGGITFDSLLHQIFNTYDATSREDVVSDLQDYLDSLKRENYILQLNSASSKESAPPASMKAAPLHLDISLTGRCNLKCNYCFYANEMAGRNDLPQTEWVAFFTELKSLGVRSATLSGGELFTRPDLWELLDALIDARMHYCILSNGTLINEKTIELMLDEKRRKRLDHIQLSIDGSCAEVHEKSRGAGSFDAVIRGFHLLREANIPVGCRSTINRHNIEDIPALASFLLNELGLPSFGTNEAMPMGAGCSNQSTITLRPADQLRAMHLLEEAEKRYPNRIHAAAGPMAKLEMYRQLEKAKRTNGQISTPWKMGRLSACGGVFQKLSINHDGVITPCNLLPSVELGRINQTSISEIWQDHPVLKSMRERQHKKTRDLPSCRECEWADYCNGSCPGLACELTGHYNQACPHDCYRTFLSAISEEDRRKTFIEPSFEL